MSKDKTPNALHQFTTLGHGRLTTLAVLVGVKPPVMHDWATGKKQVPVARCAAVELHSSGLVTRRDLRPTDWGEHWPELVTALHPWPPFGPVIQAHTPNTPDAPDAPDAPALGPAS